MQRSRCSPTFTASPVRSWLMRAYTAALVMRTMLLTNGQRCDPHGEWSPENGGAGSAVRPGRRSAPASRPQPAGVAALVDGQRGGHRGRPGVASRSHTSSFGLNVARCYTFAGDEAAGTCTVTESFVDERCAHQRRWPSRHRGRRPRRPQPDGMRQTLDVQSSRRGRLIGGPALRGCSRRGGTGGGPGSRSPRGGSRRPRGARRALQVPRGSGVQSTTAQTSRALGVPRDRVGGDPERQKSRSPLRSTDVHQPVRVR